MLGAALAWALAATIALAIAMLVRARPLAPALLADGDEVAAQVGLSPRFRTLLDDARMLRRVLETPLARLHAPLREYDLALVDARMALWRFVRSLDRVPPGERALLEALGLRSDRLRETVFAPGVLERTPDPYGDGIVAVRPDRPRVARALGDTIAGLRSFEHALAAWRPSPYR